MENQFFIDSEFLSEKALEKKHRLETDPSFGKIIWNTSREWKGFRQTYVKMS